MTKLRLFTIESEDRTLRIAAPRIEDAIREARGLTRAEIAEARDTGQLDAIATGIIAPPIVPPVDPPIVLPPAVVTPEPMVRAMIEHMQAGTHPPLPGAPNADWAKGGFVTMGGDLRSVSVPAWWGGYNFADQMEYWGWLFPWYVVWDLPGHEANLNAYLDLTELQLFALQEGDTAWRLLNSESVPAGAAYARNVVTQEGDALGFRTDIGSFGVQINPAGSVYHGWGAGSLNFDPRRIVGLHTRIRAHKRLRNPAMPDDRVAARYVLQVGLDAYPTSETKVAEFGAVGYNPGVGGSRFIEIGNDPTVVTFTTLLNARSVDTSVPRTTRQTITEARLRALPPPPWR